MPLSETASENVAHLLVTPELASSEYDFNAPRDFLPDSNVDWVVTIEFSETHDRPVIEAALGTDWQTKHGAPTIFGFAPETGHWTYVFAADAPQSFDKLKLAWSMWDGINDRPKAITANELNRYRDAAESQLKSVGGFEVRTETSAEESLESLSEVVAKCNQDVTLRLCAPSGQQFSGRDVWDVMLCLGLDYGDGDLFHWINNSGVGDDHFFTVQTTTPPGYFVPQRMASGDGDVDDLMFNFSIPRSAGPAAVFDSMTDAVEYAQRRLGGEIVMGSGEPFDESAERERVNSVVKELSRAGFVPGDSSTCRVF